MRKRLKFMVLSASLCLALSSPAFAAGRIIDLFPQEMNEEITVIEREEEVLLTEAAQEQSIAETQAAETESQTAGQTEAVQEETTEAGQPSSEEAAESSPQGEAAEEGTEAQGETAEETLPQETMEATVPQTQPSIQLVSDAPIETMVSTEDSEQKTEAVPSQAPMPAMTADGQMEVSVEIAEGTNLPIVMVLTDEEGNDKTYAINEQKEKIKIAPGTYKVKQVRDGNNKKLSKGATLTITTRSEGIYLNFARPSNAGGILQLVIHFLVTNAWIAAIIIVLNVGFKLFKRFFNID